MIAYLVNVYKIYHIKKKKIRKYFQFLQINFKIIWYKEKLRCISTY